MSIEICIFTPANQSKQLLLSKWHKMLNNSKLTLAAAQLLTSEGVELCKNTGGDKRGGYNGNMNIWRLMMIEHLSIAIGDIRLKVLDIYVWMAKFVKTDYEFPFVLFSWCVLNVGQLTRPPLSWCRVAILWYWCVCILSCILNIKYLCNFKTNCHRWAGAKVKSAYFLSPNCSYLENHLATGTMPSNYPAHFLRIRQPSTLSAITHRFWINTLGSNATLELGEKLLKIMNCGKVLSSAWVLI